MWKYSSLALLFLTCFVLTTVESSPQNGFGHALPSPIMSMPCQRNQQCTDKFPDSDCRNGIFCQCQKGFLEDFDKCLPVILDLTTECKINAQCAMGPLGNLSRCNEDTHHCECYDTVGHGKNSTAHGVHTCYYRKALGDRCDLNEECKASIRPEEDVRCDVRQRACLCADGKTCENVEGKGAFLGGSVALLLVGLVAVKVVA
ncbi:uncharacterized protein LOC110859160 [Folsomia candida]|uniref:uncharacterized protein LOC110859160 n=1 Tax=Folsomia candida TaxID=158441 RepID=UPI000B8F9E96|nr:uncharacterized protein LOC110859160 [Folsomia candida]